MSSLDAIILGIVEGLTEFLPISSTAHIMMAAKILRIVQSDFVKSFEIAIQLGAVAAMLFMFTPRLLKDIWLWKKILIAFVPTAVIGFVLYKIVKDYLVGNFAIALWCLILGGIALIATERYFHMHPDKATGGLETISNKQAFSIGIIQSLAIFPGVSRSAATIIPALFFGASRKAAVEFSFLLAIPTIAAAAFYDIIKNIGVFDGNVKILGIGFIASFIAAILSIKFFLYFIQNRSFTTFGVYRIVVAVAFFFFFL